MFTDVIRNIHIWGPSTVYQDIKRTLHPKKTEGTQHIIFCICDHFEPRWENPGLQREKDRVGRWTEMYPKLASNHRDSDGVPLQHTFFYAAEEYNEDHLEELSNLCRLGFGEIELHLHHGNDTPEGFREKIENAKRNFSKHGALITRTDPPEFHFGFIHGNWALNNSRRGGYLCGVNNELRILREAGCYGDFSLPSAPSESQTRKTNAIYYASDIPGQAKSHNKGIDVRRNGKEAGDLMIIQGPLALNWRNRKFGFLPGIENGCIDGALPGTSDRMDLWVKQRIHVLGNFDWIFIKVHCHGTQEGDMDSLLGEKAHNMFSYMEERYNDREHFKIHYVNAREMYNIVKAAENGERGNPTLYRDYLIKPYLNTRK